MRLKLVLTTSLFTALAALVTSCSKNSSVVDDWPGIDEMVLTNEAGSQALAPGDSFTLKSSLNLPRMGKDVGFTLKSDCRVSLFKNSLNAKENYIKNLYYKAEEANSLINVKVVDVLPEQAVIFPEYFDKCDFTLIAINQFGSTETKELKNQNFSFSFEKLDFNLLNGKNAYSEKDISRFIIERKNLGKYIKSKLVCLAGTRAAVTKISDKKLETTRGDILSLPESEKNHPVENCIVKAESVDGSLLISNRIQILNAELPPPPTVEINSTILDQNPTDQIFYDRDIKNDFDIIKFEITGHSETSEKYRMENSNSSDMEVKVISDLESTSREVNGLYVNKTYKMNTLSSKVKYQWEGNDTGRGFSVYSGNSIKRSLSLKPNFNCRYVVNQNMLNAELGFILSIKSGSPDFNIQKISHNDFTTDVVTTYNLLNLAKDKINLSNLPAGHNLLDDSNGLSVIFRNNKISSNTPLVLTSKVQQLRYGKNGEPAPGHENIKQYAFMTRTYPNTISCSSEFDFKPETKDQ